MKVISEKKARKIGLGVGIVIAATGIAAGIKGFIVGKEAETAKHAKEFEDLENKLTNLENIAKAMEALENKAEKSENK